MLQNQFSDADLLVLSFTEKQSFRKNSGQYKAFIFHLHQKINCLVAGKVINYMAVKELCLLCRHLMVDK